MPVVGVVPFVYFLSEVSKGRSTEGSGSSSCVAEDVIWVHMDGLCHGALVLPLSVSLVFC